MNTIQCNRAKKKLPIKLEKATFLSKQMTHSADWKVSTGAEGSVSSGADGATSEPSASSEGALAVPFTEPGRIHFNVLLSRLHTQWTIYDGAKKEPQGSQVIITNGKLPAPPSRLCLAASSPCARAVMAERTRLLRNSLEIPI